MSQRTGCIGVDVLFICGHTGSKPYLGVKSFVVTLDVTVNLQHCKHVG